MLHAGHVPLGNGVQNVRNEEIALPVPVRHKVRGLRTGLGRLHLVGGVLDLRGGFWLCLERQSALLGLRPFRVRLDALVYPGHEGLKTLHARSAFALAA